MSNRLSRETSPYLLQHANNPVDWYPWGDKALSRAKAEDKPILLSIGYSACHWCHVMAHECFEDDNIARLMNGNFINIKVDREERPDLDSIYLQAVQAIEEDHQRYKGEIDSLLADVRLQGDSQTIYHQAKQIIPIMKERLNSSLSDKEKQDIIKLLVKRALLDGLGNLTIEFAVPSPDSFASATLPHAGSKTTPEVLLSLRIPAQSTGNPSRGEQ